MPEVINSALIEEKLKQIAKKICKENGKVAGIGGL
jgi:hypothetical protein